MEDAGHEPVLMDEVLRTLALQPGEAVVDCTAGRGGHAAQMAQAIGSTGHLMLVDLDPENLRYATERVSPSGVKITTWRRSFAEVPRALKTVDPKPNALLADLGVASTHLDRPERGFSFREEGPLDMRLAAGQELTPTTRAAPSDPATAGDLVAVLPERELADLIKTWGEDPFARRIARAIVEAREREPIRTTTALAEIVRRAYGSRARESRTHPATRTFMALRIAVNDELGALGRLLDALSRASDWLAPEARVAMISFHSLEDRLIKRAFAGLIQSGRAVDLARGGVVASPEEAECNSRSRSARLRVVQLTGPTS
ncbi:MAG: 16S rRNA (cytosine(1402)-N(4))-methyltransferase [Phycisphaerae bacterium]|nr:16S rRNA (cytosine(1402)-N(4))-methyltransferase [Phycisphaerae bacterium]